MPSQRLTIGGYRFRSAKLLNQALTHGSFGPDHNERLEFLGDAVLGSLIADDLYGRLATDDEGVLTRTRATLVNRRTLARIAHRLGIPDRLRLGEGELRNRGYQRESILSGAVEALIGAIYLDAGYAGCRSAVLPWFESEVAAVLSNTERKDPKTRLQELLQAQGRPLPRYHIQKTAGEAHALTFTVECTVAGLPAPVTGTDSSRKGAEQQAARAALAQMAAVS